tara:strand:+ start:212 stop:487 length:276 start_codon:yes stop_codon:yes gene_type:complete
MLVELVEVKRRFNGSYNVAKILLNPRHIIYIQEDTEMNQLLSEGKIDFGLDKSITFSKVKLNEFEHTQVITVIGSPNDIQSKLSKKQILRG